MGDSLSCLDNLLFILDRPHKLDRYFNLEVDFNSEKRKYGYNLDLDLHVYNLYDRSCTQYCLQFCC